MKAPDTNGRSETDPLTEAEIAEMARIADAFQQVTEAIRNAKTVGDILEVDRLVDAIQIE